MRTNPVWALTKQLERLNQLIQKQQQFNEKHVAAYLKQQQNDNSDDIFLSSSQSEEINNNNKQNTQFFRYDVQTLDQKLQSSTLTHHKIHQSTPNQYANQCVINQHRHHQKGMVNFQMLDEQKGQNKKSEKSFKTGANKNRQGYYPIETKMKYKQLGQLYDNEIEFIQDEQNIPTLLMINNKTMKNGLINEQDLGESENQTIHINRNYNEYESKQQVKSQLFFNTQNQKQTNMIRQKQQNQSQQKIFVMSKANDRDIHYKLNKQPSREKIQTKSKCMTKTSRQKYLNDKLRKQKNRVNHRMNVQTKSKPAFPTKIHHKDQSTSYFYDQTKHLATCLTTNKSSQIYFNNNVKDDFLNTKNSTKPKNNPKTKLNTQINNKLQNLFKRPLTSQKQRTKEQMNQQNIKKTMDNEFSFQNQIKNKKQTEESGTFHYVQEKQARSNAQKLNKGQKYINKKTLVNKIRQQENQKVCNINQKQQNNWQQDQIQQRQIFRSSVSNTSTCKKWLQNSHKSAKKLNKINYNKLQQNIKKYENPLQNQNKNKKNKTSKKQIVNNLQKYINQKSQANILPLKNTQKKQKVKTSKNTSKIIREDKYNNHQQIIQDAPIQQNLKFKQIKQRCMNVEDKKLYDENVIQKLNFRDDMQKMQGENLGKNMFKAYNIVVNKYAQAANKINNRYLKKLEQQIKQISEQAIYKMKIVSAIIVFITQFFKPSRKNVIGMITKLQIQQNNKSYFNYPQNIPEALVNKTQQGYGCNQNADTIKVSQDTLILSLLQKPKCLVNFIQKLPSLLYINNMLCRKFVHNLLSGYRRINEQIDKQLNFQLFLVKKTKIFHYLHSLAQLIQFLVENKLVQTTDSSNLNDENCYNYEYNEIMNECVGYYSSRSRQYKKLKCRQMKKYEGADSERRVKIKDSNTFRISKENKPEYRSMLKQVSGRDENQWINKRCEANNQNNSSTDRNSEINKKQNRAKISKKQSK